MSPLARMSGRELRAERAARDMTGVEFGAYLATLLGRERPYDRREISSWETAAIPIPEAVERALLRVAINGASGR